MTSIPTIPITGSIQTQPNSAPGGKADQREYGDRRIGDNMDIGGAQIVVVVVVPVPVAPVVFMHSIDDMAVIFA